MTDDDLIACLCARIGAIMEDASFVAVTVRSVGERDAAIRQLEQASDRIAALIGAVRTLVDCG